MYCLREFVNRTAIFWRLILICASFLNIVGCTSDEGSGKRSAGESSDGETASVEQAALTAIDELSKRTGATQEWNAGFEGAATGIPVYSIEIQDTLGAQIGKKILVIGRLDDIHYAGKTLRLSCSYVPPLSDRPIESAIVFSLEISPQVYEQLREQMAGKESHWERQIALAVVPHEINLIPKRDLRAFVEVEEGEEGQKEAQVEEGHFGSVVQVQGECVDLEYLGEYWP